MKTKLCLVLISIFFVNKVNSQIQDTIPLDSAFNCGITYTVDTCFFQHIGNSLELNGNYLANGCGSKYVAIVKILKDSILINTVEVNPKPYDCDLITNACFEFSLPYPTSNTIVIFDGKNYHLSVHDTISKTINQDTIPLDSVFNCGITHTGDTCFFQHIGNSLELNGNYLANGCGSKYVAVVKILKDSILINTVEVNPKPYDCDLITNACFEFSLPYPTSNTIVIFDGKNYHLSVHDTISKLINQDTIPLDSVFNCGITYSVDTCFFQHIGNFLQLNGIYMKRGCGKHVAVVNKMKDSIIINTMEINTKADDCDIIAFACFEFSLPYPTSNTIVIFDGKNYHLSVHDTISKLINQDTIPLDSVFNCGITYSVDTCFFQHIGNFLQLNGIYMKRGCGKHVAVVNKMKDSIIINTMEINTKADDCDIIAFACFEFSLPYPTSNTIIIFDGKNYHLSVHDTISNPISQDTIANNLSNSDCPTGVNVKYIGDTLMIYGTIGVAICAKPVAIVTYKTDSIIINTTSLGNCVCNSMHISCFEIKVNNIEKDTILKFNDTIYRLKPSIKSVTSISSPISNSKIIEYPNPTNGLINIELQEIDLNNYLLEIYDLTGMKIMSKNINNSRVIINIDSFKAGCYVLCIKHNSNIIQRELILKR